MENRVTGTYVRIKRDDRWQNIEFDQLTNIEMEEFSKNQKNEGWKWALFFAKWIRDNIKER